MLRLSKNYGEPLGAHEAICLSSDYHNLTKRGVYHVEKIEGSKVLVIDNSDCYNWYDINIFC